MTKALPITVSDFKTYFCQDNGFDFQPYPTWKKTAFDTDEWCLDEHIFYASMVNGNAVRPSEDGDGVWAQNSELWSVDTEYPVNTVVYYSGHFYVSTATTTSEPTDITSWKVLSDSDLLERFPGYREWATPIAYQTGDKVIAMKNFKLRVFQSTIDSNYYSPDNSLITTTPEPEYAWDETDEDVDYILDSEIERAMGEALFKFNPGLVPNEEKRKIISLYLTAFFVAYDRQMANAGLNSSSSAGPVVSRTVGKMSVTYMQSTLFNKHPSYEFFAKNQYGIKAFNLLLPYLRGNVLVLRGGPTAE